MSVEPASHEVQKHLVIDGQQRLTTFSILLVLIRDLTRIIEDKKLAEEIHENSLVKNWENNDSHYKLLPTQVDREVYIDLIGSKQTPDKKSNLYQAYSYFKTKNQNSSIDLRELKTLVSSGL